MLCVIYRMQTGLFRLDWWSVTTPFVSVKSFYIYSGYMFLGPLLEPGRVHWQRSQRIWLRMSVWLQWKSHIWWHVYLLYHFAPLHFFVYSCQLSVSFSACGEFRWHYPVQVQCCFMSTETIGTFRVGEPRMATSTFTHLLGSDYSFTAVHFMSITAQFLGAVSKSWIAYAPCHIACAVCLVKSYSYDKK